MKETDLPENKIDKNVDKIVNEVTSSVWMKRLFKLALASVFGPLAGGLTCGATYEIGDEICLLAGWSVGVIVFFIILMKK